MSTLEEHFAGLSKVKAEEGYSRRHDYLACLLIQAHQAELEEAVAFWRATHPQPASSEATRIAELEAEIKRLKGEAAQDTEAADIIRRAAALINAPGYKGPLDNAHARIAELEAALNLASEALAELQDRAGNWSVSGVYFDEPCFKENVAALAKADKAEDAVNAALAALPKPPLTGGAS